MALTTHQPDIARELAGRLESMNAERQVNASLIGEPYVFSPDETTACRKGLMKRGLFEKCWNFYLAKFGLTNPG